MRRFALPALALGIFSISTGAIFARLAEAPSLAIAAYRLLIASAMLAPFALIYRRDEIMRLESEDLLSILAAGAFLALHFGTWISSLEYTSVASSVVLVNTIPIWVGIWAFFKGEKLPKSTWIALLLSLIGGVLVGYGDFSLDPKALLGDFLAVVGGITVSGYVILGRKVRRKTSLLTYISLCYGSAAILMCVTNFILGIKMTSFSSWTWSMFVCVAIVPQLLGHTSYNWALGYFSAEFIAVALLGEPIGSSILAFMLFGELPTPIMFVGFAFLMCAITLAAMGEQKSSPNQ